MFAIGTHVRLSRAVYIGSPRYAYLPAGAVGIVVGRIGDMVRVRFCDRFLTVSGNLEKVS